MPRQIGTQNSLELLEDPKAAVVDEVAAKLGLRKVLRPSRGPWALLGMSRFGAKLSAVQGQGQDGTFLSLTCVYWVPVAFMFLQFKVK